ncbi:MULTISPECIES: NADP-dependent oxidoreductase [Catenuloplanes]|uniref:NADPH:quinone reductase-like Zn-dependent oxidoreductase n=1 Tax=Catenuloplanes niger TaxID=587534 RepID=A0AAE3ZMJ8_9ACTN|nr:NADP-dependent oxidoreductase [Catenuloplanes niger]MDR7320610.1 NADPH:quinone reductase-like Zn-dependent oxidoreductase [Catenuloplanes niger]
MRALRFHEYGGPLAVDDDVPAPTAGPGRTLVTVAATAFNPVDLLIHGGFLEPALPHIPGVEMSGTTPDGRTVIAALPMNLAGAAAELVAVPDDLLAPAPRSIPLADAAAIPGGALTAWQAVTEHADVRAGQRVLVNGAGGGVGGFAVQFAKRRGATVVATASPRSTAAVRAAGADQIIDYTGTDLTTALTEPVDVVISLSRGVPGLSRLVRPGGVLVSAVGPAEPADGVRIVEMYVRADAAQLTEISRLVDAGEIRVDVSERRPVAGLSEIFARAAKGDLRGKVVLLVQYGDGLRPVRT